MNRIHPKFWKCDADLGDCYTYSDICGAVNPSSQAICRCGNDPSANERDFPPATNQEVLIAWLTADDERRKEIEIASRPSEDCHVKEYLTYWMYEPTGTPRDSLWSYSDYTAHRDYPNVGGLWLPIGEPDSQVKQ